MNYCLSIVAHSARVAESFGHSRVVLPRFLPTPHLALFRADVQIYGIRFLFISILYRSRENLQNLAVFHQSN